jgi:hypothetical protein
LSDDRGQWTAIEAGAVAGVASRTLLTDLHQYGVAVTVKPDLAYPLPMTTGLTLDPVLLPTARKKRGASRGECPV